ncbi:hypothetical protein ACFVKB_14070 [Rhodococcus sp. NPDC127530]|jgi:hypothetical protein
MDGVLLLVFGFFLGVAGTVGYRSRDVARNGELIGSQPHRRRW